MKKHILLGIFFVFATSFLWSCADKIDNSEFSDIIGKGQDYVPEPPIVEGPTLKETTGWEIDSIGKGYIWYNYSNNYGPFNSKQIVNVLELDLSNPEYRIEIIHTTSDSLSSVAQKYNAIAGINGTYELEASYVKTGGTIISEVTLSPDHLRYWKHEGALFYNGLNQASIEYGTTDSYKGSTMPNILSGAPMLIDDYNPVGESFVGDISGLDLNSLDYEDYRRHQGVRHPRTAVAMTGDNKILLITVDGRRTESAGMTAKELTLFVDRYFKPQSALNIDGGGSTTMYIKDSGVSDNDVVNYPTDNNKLDHYGQRKVSTFILIKKVSNEAPFAGGNGTEYDPYIITKPLHMNSMHSNVDWSDATTNPIYFKLEADIDMSGIDWIPINTASGFSRHLHFDGNGHVIKNLKSTYASYASLFGVLCGSCKNLGIINANIKGSGSGVGIIAGYVGERGPNKPTGTIDNCYTSGVVEGSDAVGGIAGNIGKENGSQYSTVRNSYSTATVKATSESSNSRAGGIVGIAWSNSEILNCYSSGTVISSASGAGGVAGYSDVNIVGCVGLNKKIVNTTKGNLGRLSAFMGGAPVQGVNCWALDVMVLDNGGTPKTDDQLVTGTVPVFKSSYDGESKAEDFLKNIANYEEIGWAISGQNQVWSQKTNSKGYPILLWQFNRGDYDAISGHE